jgi:hypothetical protein
MNRHIGLSVFVVVAIFVVVVVVVVVVVAVVVVVYNNYFALIATNKSMAMLGNCKIVDDTFVLDTSRP